MTLSVKDLDVHYKDFQALWNVSLSVKSGGIVSVIGANGSGKSTLLNTIAGLSRPSKGSVEFSGRRIDDLQAYQILGLGVSLVPEGRRVFARLTVYENLVMGSYLAKARAARDETLARLYELFPVLKARGDQMANTLSGGEQQMLAIGRALMSGPRLLLCDEISLGLAPVVIKDIYKRLELINGEGMTIMLVEQDIRRSLKASNYTYVMLEGKVVLQGDPSSFTEEAVRKAYFGV
ncbi:MAG: ABC transporter ATP-binding protein [Desulfobacteraceae bacterium]|nr:MAG: ABC transporter ATP-binding protein [Desulfobacteraceae bacterium]